MSGNCQTGDRGGDGQPPVIDSRLRGLDDKLNGLSSTGSLQSEGHWTQGNEPRIGGNDTPYGQTITPLKSGNQAIDEIFQQFEASNRSLGGMLEMLK